MIGLRHILVGGLAAFAFGGSVLAADVPARGPVYTKAPPAVSYFEGVYIGVHGGYAWGDSNLNIGAASFLVSPDGGFGGVQFGYNYQLSGNWILGYEIDVSFGGVKGIEPLAGGTFEAEYFGTARTRLGYVQGPWMIFATGGVAWANTKGTGLLGGLVDLERPQVGWTIGAGIEYALNRNWSAKLEYLYADLGATNFFSGGAINSDLTMNIVRVGLNYRFDNFGAVAQPASYPVKAPMRAAFTWTGPYIGIHGGYAWGDFQNTIGGLVIPGMETDGGIFGIQSGYNWQISKNWVIGVEADSSWGSVKGSEPLALQNVKVDAMGTIRARAGYAFDRLLVYATGGLAWAHSDSMAFGAFSSDRFYLGWTAGAGIEWALSPHWSAKFEYAYADIDTGGDLIGGVPAQHTLDIHTIKLGLNYRAGIFDLLGIR